MGAGDLQGRAGLATMYVALEFSRSNWLVAIQGFDEGRRSRHKVGAGDAKRGSGTPAVRVCSCYEAGYEGF
jgi:hypothetical protein